jgi:hypothetical protein
MAIYQVLDETNFALNEYQSYDQAVSFSQDLAAWFPDHRYHIETLVFEGAVEQAH